MTADKKKAGRRTDATSPARVAWARNRLNAPRVECRRPTGMTGEKVQALMRAVEIALAELQQ